ncbi:MFS transporter [Aspergillus clavatus NRRL 1]|uniref:Autophagy-related protein 22-1 n=1 Tax=Aspergillus clavatus (strain ATCC 1007 / CBS 513.65 / DSM 816 / NCTC 3887 / NRRL 1 / QM 1276 / 107) TaxID=344612 RepID=AT221_ASPCL|nr:MFS transporter family protein, putative [Aspergillus clavatus NRRL 1]A1C7M3.1 RecName: Full=Autophagy-related protein 22-1 [Aspergillus clavatus NRRL 1]EAW14394.1 MFS transporter family protein, putative [Aspergillus clavatus NRRL 1]
MIFTSTPPAPPPADAQQRQPRYPGEDTTPTSRREIWGWYTYGIAAEVFAVCGVGSFLPLTLEQLARERGTLLSSHLPCVGPGSPSAAPGNGTTPAMLRRDGLGSDQCVVGLFGLQINTASFAMYTFSLAVLVQALTLISFSALADYEKNRKTLLLTFGLIGSVSSMLFVFISPRLYILGAILVVIGVTCLGSSFVVLNSFLPVLVANDPSIQTARKTEGEELPHLDSSGEYTRSGSFNRGDNRGFDDYVAPEHGLKPKTTDSTSPEMQLSTKISSKGVGLGYCAAVLVQVLSILLLFTLSKTSLPKISGTLPLRFVLLLVGIWWFSFTVVTRRWLRNRPGPPLDTSKGGARWRIWLRLVGFAWKSLWKTVKVAAKLREVVIFLIAWFLLSDAMATVSGTAILFARTELKMSTTAVGLLSITATLSGMTGAFLWPVVSRRLKLKSNHTIMLCIALFEIIPLYGMLAYIPLVKKWGVIGLQQPWEIFPLGIVHGLVSGGLSSYCRSFFGVLIPPGSEAAFYALYAATDKGSSFIGPAVVGVLIDATGQVRSGFFFIAVLIVLPIPLIWMVNAEKGRQEGLAMAEMLEKSHGENSSEFGHPSEEAEGLLARNP